jgi:hypothetical protein
MANAFPMRREEDEEGLTAESLRSRGNAAEFVGSPYWLGGLRDFAVKSPLFPPPSISLAIATVGG